MVPRGKLGAALAEIERLSASYNMRVANVFHAGDGNLHPLILYNGREAGAYERAEQLAGDILDLCVSFGGSITGEHGIGVEKRAYLPKMFSEHDIDTMCPCATPLIRPRFRTAVRYSRAARRPASNSPARTRSSARG